MRWCIQAITLLDVDQSQIGIRGTHLEKNSWRAQYIDL